MNINNCDTCNKKTYMNPDREIVQEDRTIEYEIPVPVKAGVDKATGKDVFIMEMQKQTKTIQKPVMTYQRRMDAITGKIVKHPVPKIIYKQPLTVFVRLKIGGDIIQRDFCEECIKGGNEKAKEIFEQAEKLWDLLEGIDGCQ